MKKKEEEKKKKPNRCSVISIDIWNWLHANKQEDLFGLNQAATGLTL
jgi:hypothetical protein